MVRTARVFAWVLAAAVAVAPLSAAVYKVTLKNGTTFETRYEPEDASWDKEKIVLLDEWGNQISLARADVDTIVSDVAAKGYGRMIDNTTIALGWAPNDAAEPETAGGSGGTAEAGGQQPPANQEQFVEPDQMQGIPGNWIGYPSTTPNAQPAPSPAPAPPPASVPQ